ncbi:hypothetical protein [[Phormidium] sp. ETS-05]|uniref:hypothetical protein n=1 Tax=[Phormidium] sp. ETS-05 TaxID=222819 RepID=UPI0018EF06C3|nr:hypothetical protein [[Phormidium] sp. ETS-05]
MPILRRRKLGVADATQPRCSGNPHRIGFPSGWCPNGCREENPQGQDHSGNPNRQDDVNLRQLIYTYITTTDGQLRNYISRVKRAPGSADQSVRGERLYYGIVRFPGGIVA